MKKFLWKICPFILFILVLEIAIPMAVDPYNVFHWRQIRDNGVEPNSNYIKMEYILHNPDKFDSFLFGSSRTGFVNVDRIPEGKWYNMSYSEGLPAEHLENLQTMIEHGIIPKNVMIGVDNISCFVNPELHQNQFYRIPYPRNNKLGFYANYFSIKGVILSLDVILNYEPEDADYVEHYYKNGCTVRDPSLGGTWDGDTPYWDDYYTDRISYAIEDMKQIAALCEEYDINLIVFTNPLFYRTYQESEFYGYESFLLWLSGASGGGGGRLMYYVYLLRCGDGTLYAGYTNDLQRRLAVHNAGKRAKYTRSRLPVELVYWESFSNKSSALKREYAIKQCTRKEKLALIQTFTSRHPI